MTEQELILTHILDCNRTKIYLDKPSLNKNQSKRLEEILFLRKKGQPLQYILGECEFMGLRLKVNKNVFIPRPETEILVEKIIDCRPNLPAGQAGTIDHRLKILDIGTGSGNIAVSLAKFIPTASIIATDIQAKVLEVAKFNAKHNGVQDRIEFVQADLFSFGKFDFIVSNPPYIPSQEIDNLQQEVKYEPRISLDGGIDGLDFYRRIIKESPAYLKESGFLIMEMGYNQAEPIKKIVEVSEFKLIEIVNDYSNIERVIVLKVK